MQKALQIHFHGVEASDALEARIREKVADLERRCPDVTSCRVTVEKGSRNHVKGNLFRISLVLLRPGRDIVVNRGPKDQGHADVYVALRDTFEAAERQLEELGWQRPQAEEA
jgi:ribosome-associated translation inhibitor RaiA